MDKTSQQIRREIEAVEASRKDTWDEYEVAMEEASSKLEEYRKESQKLSELYAEEHLILTKERGMENG